MKEYCFVIQPFDSGKFDKRYDDVFEPTLNKIGLEAYRVDKDSSVNIPIDAIEEQIKNSRLCLADITTDNPNVWYEVGYAIASGKEIILICSDERKTSYPFDIIHRNVLSYKTESQSDFTVLSDKLTRRAKAILNNPVTVLPAFSLNLDINGLNYNEIALIGAILVNQDTPIEIVSAWGIKQDMKRSGLNEIAFSLAIRKLLNKKFLEIENMCDYSGNEGMGYGITEYGNKWIIENEDKFSLTAISKTEEFIEIASDYETPF